MYILLFISLERARGAYERGEENMTVGDSLFDDIFLLL
jgi:hypothetical protein